MKHTASTSSSTLTLGALATALALSGCSSLNSLGGDQPLDYRSKATKTQPLEVPPDLSQLTQEGRFGVQAGRPVSASTFGQTVVSSTTPGMATAVAPQSVGEVRLVREGDARRLVATMSPEVVYQRALAFWKESGFNIETDRPEAGIIETDWAENRAKLPKDFIRSIIGRIADGLYSTGERDRYRTRIERTAQGTEITITHRGLQETGSGNPVERGESTRWNPRPNDPSLEAEFLYRLMAKLGAPEAQIQAARGNTVIAASALPGSSLTRPAAPAQPDRARTVDGKVQVDEGFDRAWRRVGLALDRSGFTVEDRDRAGGTYFVRYVDRGGEGSPGWVDRMLNVFRSDDSRAKLNRYRIVVRGEGDSKSVVQVLNSNGQPDNSATAKAMLDSLFKELR